MSDNPYVGMKCRGCRKKYRGRGQWNVELKAGVVEWMICPSCQTPEENAEADIREATTDYYRDGFGRIMGIAKVDND